MEPNQVILGLLAVIALEAVKDGIIAWRLITRLFGAPPPVTPPVVPPVEPAPVPPVVVPPVPTPPLPVAPRNTGITATWFNDSMGAYGPIDSNKPGVALPAAFASPRPKVRVFANGKTVDCDIVDKGPWYDGTPTRPADPYWTTGSRPRAETDPHTNGAGIDLTPPALSALGLSPSTGKYLVDWDFVDARAPATPEAPSAPVAGDGLVKQTWPTQAECPTFYGSPSTVAASLVHVHCPWVFTVEGTKSQTITIHTKCAASLTRVLNYIWKEVSESQDKIHEFGYDVFDGSYNPRNIAGTNTPSVHSYAAAMDWNAAANPQHAPLTKTKFKSDSLIVFAFKAEGWIWGGDWSPAYIDAMHFQAARVR